MRNLTDELEFDRVTNCNDLQHHKNQNYTTNSSTFKISIKYFGIFHQNIRGLSSNELDEPFVTLLANPPHIIRLTEHLYVVMK
jgi:hypothetical protein